MNYAFVDFQNTDTTTKKLLGFAIDWEKLFSYKNRDKEINILCPKCGNRFIEKIDMGFNKKANCDVDLTVDAMDFAESGNIFYIFTGDGDFEFLVKNVILKGVKAYIISSARKVRAGGRYFTSRLSKKLRQLCGGNTGRVSFIEINDIKLRISK